MITFMWNVSIDYTHTIPSVPFWNILLHNYDIIRFNHATSIYRYVYRLLRSVHWNLNHLNSNFRMTYGVWQDITINMKMVLNIYIHYSSEIKRIFWNIARFVILIFCSKCMHKLETNAYKSLIWMDWEIAESYIDGTKDNKRVLSVTFDMFQLGLPWFYQNDTFSIIIPRRKTHFHVLLELNLSKFP